MLHLFVLLILSLGFASGQRVAVIGDWGSDTPLRAQVAEALRTAHAAQPFDLLATLGDNFYPSGVPVQRFLDELPKVKIYPAFGNHDIPALAQQLKLFGLEASYYTFKQGNVQFFMLNSEDFSKAQQAWLESSLKASVASWKVVALHRPLYSSGLHGGSRSLRVAIEPLLIRYKVNLVLAGHDHSYERLESNGIAHIVSGGGGAWTRGFGVVKKESLVRRQGAHFLVLEATETQLAVSAYAPSGEVWDRLVLTSRP